MKTQTSTPQEIGSALFTIGAVYKDSRNKLPLVGKSGCAGF
jgi:hypothetical protein